jgi:hypothetical protein
MREVTANLLIFDVHAHMPGKQIRGRASEYVQENMEQRDGQRGMGHLS